MGAGVGKCAVALLLLLLAVNLGLWLVALVQFRDVPALLGVALLVYGLGLRHAIDVDHIAAIDNVTRKLMHDGQRPVGVGFYFALGHSSIVLAATAAAVCVASTLPSVDGYRRAAGLVGGTFSALFFGAVALLNAGLFRQLLRRWRSADRNVDFHSHAHPSGGILARLLARGTRLVSRSRHMFVVGLMFGVGFDTASEVALIGTSAAQVANGVPLASAMLFPLLFTAGMALVDTADGVTMLKVYHWAMVRPERTLIYNMAITSVSALVSLLIALAATSQLLDRVPGSALLAGFAFVRDRSEALGLALTIALLTCWLMSCASRPTEAIGDEASPAHARPRLRWSGRA